MALARPLVALAMLVAVACQSAAPPAAAHDVRLEAAADGPVAALVASATARATAAGRRLLVYVGASWCEPCVEFHRAAAAGTLDDTLAGVTFLEFDADRDEARLTAAGYASTYLPLFAVPAADGNATARRIEGASRGGGGYARQIAARLAPLVD